MAWVAAAVIGGSVISGVMGANASSNAADAQVQASQNAQNTQLAMYNQTRADQAPWRQAGSNALSQLSTRMGMAPQPALTRSQLYAQLLPQYTRPGIPASSANQSTFSIGSDMLNGIYPQQNQAGSPSTVDDAGLNAAIDAQLAQQQQDMTAAQNDPNFGSLTHQFDANDLKTNLAPNYNFMLGQGLGAINNQASVNGGLVGGNALKGINDYAQNYASNGYQQAFNNYNTNQTNIFNRLSNIAGLGQTSNGQTAQVGTALAGNIGSAQMAGGAAQAAGIVGGANAITGGINNATGMYGLNSMLGGNLFGGGSSSGSSGVGTPYSGDSMAYMG